VGGGEKELNLGAIADIFFWRMPDWQEFAKFEKGEFLLPLFP
jgi:hypothetical protein